MKNDNFRPFGPGLKCLQFNTNPALYLNLWLSGGWNVKFTSSYNQHEHFVQDLASVVVENINVLELFPLYMALLSVMLVLY